MAEQQPDPQQQLEELIAAQKLLEEQMVIPPFFTDVRSRTVMQPWPDAALG